MKIASKRTAGFFLCMSLSFHAIAADDMAKPSAADVMKADAAMPMATGEIKKIDIEAGKITIKHGPLINLDMPAMTMVFRVKDSAILEQVKAGDKIKFVAEKANGTLTVTTIQVDK